MNEVESAFKRRFDNEMIVFHHEKQNKTGSCTEFDMFCAEWNDARNRLINSGVDLSKIAFIGKKKQRSI